MDPPVETFTIDGLTVTIHQDTDPSNPREDDNLGTMRCWHRNYNLGDSPHPRDRYDHHAFCESLLSNAGVSDPSTISDSDLLDAVSLHYIILPLYLYDHSGISISTGSFVGRAQHAEWDSGQVGWIYVSISSALAEHSRKRMSPKLRALIIETLKGEVSTYDDFLTGQVYGFTITSPSGDDLDSCWGIYGLDYARSEATSIAADLVTLHGAGATAERLHFAAGASD